MERAQSTLPVGGTPQCCAVSLQLEAASPAGNKVGACSHTGGLCFGVSHSACFQVRVEENGKSFPGIFLTGLLLRQWRPLLFTSYSYPLSGKGPKATQLGNMAEQYDLLVQKTDRLWNWIIHKRMLLAGLDFEPLWSIYIYSFYLYSAAIRSSFHFIGWKYYETTLKAPVRILIVLESVFCWSLRRNAFLKLVHTAFVPARDFSLQF